MQKFLSNSFIIVLIALICVSFSSDNKRKLPSVNIKTLDGQTVNTSDFSNDGNPVIVSFWATWCKPCIQELTTIHEVYEDWQEETGVKLIAVSTDNSRNSHKVLPMTNSNGWEYEFYLDENGDFQRAMGVNLIPHTFILDSDMNVVWQHTSFTEGGELEIYQILKKIKNGEEISE